MNEYSKMQTKKSTNIEEKCGTSPNNYVEEY